jgi:hypothetical protein
MGARAEVESRVRSGWIDPKVAEWVLRNFPLLEFDGASLACPVYKLDDVSSVAKFKDRLKIVISGGFEGTKGHLEAIRRDLPEIRALDREKWGALLVVMLEPDSYIITRKGRKPIVNLDERQELWSASGLVDAVIILPEEKRNESVASRYALIHKKIEPALWCTNKENPSHYEILMRRDLNMFDISRLLLHEPRPHASFLASTQKLKAEEVRVRLRDYITDLVKNAASCYNLPPEIPANEVDYIAGLYINETLKGL